MSEKKDILNNEGHERELTGNPDSAPEVGAGKVKPQENENLKQQLAELKKTLRKKDREIEKLARSNQFYEQHKILLDAATELNSAKSFHSKIEKTLALIGKQLQVSRVYIFENNEDRTTTTNTFEWCNDGIAPEIDNLQNLPYRIFPSWKVLLDTKGEICANNIRELPADIYELLEPQGIKAILAFPIRVKSHTYGFIGFDECTTPRVWNKREKELLSKFSSIISNTFERQSMEESVIKSEKRYRELTEFLPEMICEVDLNARITYVNQFALQKIGYTEQEVAEKQITVFSLFHPQDLARAKNNFTQIVSEKKSLVSEYQVKTKHNGELHVVIYTTPIIEDGSVTGLRGVMVDISKQKQSEEMVRFNLKRQKIVSKISMKLNSLDDFANQINKTIKLVGSHLNASRVYIFQNNKENSATNNTYEWCAKGVAPQMENMKNIEFDESWISLLKQQHFLGFDNFDQLPAPFSSRIRKLQEFSTIVFPLFFDNKLTGFIGYSDCSNQRPWTKSEVEFMRTVSNIVANSFIRKKTFQIMKESERENRAIIDSIPDMIFHFNETGEIISYKSSRKENFLLQNPDKQHTIFDIFEETLAANMLVAIKECLTNGSFKFDFNLLKQEELAYFEARFVVLNSNEVVAIIRDVTEAREKEKQLQEAKIKAEDVSKAKSEFLANVSHEIRTPMNAILGFSEWLYDNVDNELHRNYLHTILTSGRTLLALINDILDLSRVESGNMTIELEPMQYRVVATEIRQVFRQKLEAKNLTLNINTDPSVPGFVYMDEVRFYQILFNLIGNAIKFTGKGFINLFAYAQRTDDPTTIKLIVEIEDTGIGIPEDQQTKIFQAFSQQSGQSNRYYEGTGLGLAIVSGLLKKLNGSIRLKSKTGRGSVFTIQFNDVRVADIKEKGFIAEKEDAKLVLDPCKILIVDDVNFNILVLKRIIEFEHVTFLEATSGEQALEIMNEDQPDLVFMDIRMPGLNGYNVTEIIKENPRFKNIPVVAFTASTLAEDQERIDATFDAFLQKPVFKKEVMAVLKRFLPHKYVKDETIATKETEQSLLIDPQLKSHLPEIIGKLEGDFFRTWEEIKDDLIIYEIEDFSQKLSDYLFGQSCQFLSNYCRELNLSLQSFDIDQIEKKLSEYPELIQKLKTQL
ncbi:ATP-binding protein [Mangrovibacterium marinum]|uniref:histidine kinase n=1 Tax=Mangrovibacterium marinum TaxID=1639118 RepID=A0A2T5C6G8_9BACT|nr:ATP-binding protein [Mangrovibacterium marinum]PTN10545.1 PAS domain S-box-containing protein [Mangrovibacterium marinum]